MINKFSTRYRILAVQVLYTLEVIYPPINYIEEIDQFIKKTSSISSYRKDSDEDKSLLCDMILNLKKIDEFILEFAHKNDTVDTIPKVVLAILRTGIHEIVCNKNTYLIGSVIKDYLNIARIFSHNESVGFINSVLDALWKKYGTAV